MGHTMKDFKVEFAVAAVVLAVLAILAVASWGDAEVKTYIDPDNNVFCYYNSGGIECFLYNDEGTHLELKP